MNRGFTLIELLVAMTIFTLVLGSGAGLFVSAVQSQRRSLANQELLDQTSYLIEHISKSVRMAKKDISGACTGTVKLNYSFSSQCLKFKSYDDQCKQFCLSNGRLENEDGAPLTADDLVVEKFEVNLSGETQADDYQPKVTIFLKVRKLSEKPEEAVEVNLQTTISQRNLDVQY